jgi:biotin carboxyl carrier protein
MHPATRTSRPCARRPDVVLRNDPAMGTADRATTPASQTAVLAPFAGVVVSVARQADEQIAPGSPLLVLEAMKMEHEVLVDAGGVVHSIEVAIGDAVEEGQLLALIAAAEGDAAHPEPLAQAAPGGFRADLEAVRERHAVGLDAARPDAVARRR